MIGESGSETQMHLVQTVLQELIDNRDWEHKADEAKDVVLEGSHISCDDAPLN